MVSINRFSADTDAEIALVKDACAKLGVEALMADHWAMGGEGAADVARAVVKVVRERQEQAEAALSRRDAADGKNPHHRQRNLPRQGHRRVDKRSATSSPCESMGYGNLPVCMAKTQYSFSTNADAKGAPNDHVIAVRDVRLSAGAEFVVAICGRS